MFKGGKGGGGAASSASLTAPAIIVVLVLLLGATIYLWRARYIRRRTAYTTMLVLVLVWAELRHDFICPQCRTSGLRPFKMRPLRHTSVEARHTSRRQNLLVRSKEPSSIGKRYTWIGPCIFFTSSPA